MNEDSLYFHHFLKVVYSRACENRRMWIKARKLKDENILKKAFYKRRIKVSIFTIYINTKGGMVMFIGQIGQIRTPTHMGNRGILAVQANSPFTPRQVSQPRHDRVEIGTQNQQVNETAIDLIEVKCVHLLLSPTPKLHQTKDCKKRCCLHLNKEHIQRMTL